VAAQVRRVLKLLAITLSFVLLGLVAHVQLPDVPGPPPGIELDAGWQPLCPEFPGSWIEEEGIPPVGKEAGRVTIWDHPGDIQVLSNAFDYDNYVWKQCGLTGLVKLDFLRIIGKFPTIQQELRLRSIRDVEVKSGTLEAVRLDLNTRIAVISTYQHVAMYGLHLISMGTQKYLVQYVYRAGGDSIIRVGVLQPGSGMKWLGWKKCPNENDRFMRDPIVRAEIRESQFLLQISVPAAYHYDRQTDTFLTIAHRSFHLESQLKFPD